MMADKRPDPRPGHPGYGPEAVQAAQEDESTRRTVVNIVNSYDIRLAALELALKRDAPDPEPLAIVLANARRFEAYLSRGDT